MLGRGGSGTVYAAIDRGGREVALKVLHADLSLSNHERARFIEEAQRMRRLDHEGLIALAGSGELPDGTPYLCMPRLRGETLSARLRRGPLPVDDALAAFEALADALAALHEAGLLHRDIKPCNVFLAEGAGGPRPVLLDLGIARDLGDPTGTTTAAGRIRGTPAFMAPERLFGTGATARSDVYELAITLYLMLVGRRPWERDHDAESRLNPKTPEAQGVTLPGALSTCLLRALSTRPELRPAGARDFADAVRASLTVDPQTARPTVTLDAVARPSLPDATTKRMAPRGRTLRWRGATRSALVLAAATLAAFVVFRPHPAAPASEPAMAHAAVALASGAPAAPATTSAQAAAQDPPADPPIASVARPQPARSPPVAAAREPSRYGAPARSAPAAPDHFYSYRK